MSTTINPPRHTLKYAIAVDKQIAWENYHELAAAADARLKKLIVQMDQAHRDAANSTLCFGGTPCL